MDSVNPKKELAIVKRGKYKRGSKSGDSACVFNLVNTVYGSISDSFDSGSRYGLHSIRRPHRTRHRQARQQALREEDVALQVRLPDHGHHLQWRAHRRGMPTRSRSHILTS